MTARRRLLAAASAAAAVALLAGCEKPAPIVTVASGTQSEWKEADVYCFDGQSFERDECVERSDEIPEIEVAPGARVSVDVSKAVAERGWVVELAPEGGPGDEGPLLSDDSYFTFTAPAEVIRRPFQVVVRALGEDVASGVPSGEWTFRLVAED